MRSKISKLRDTKDYLLNHPIVKRLIGWTKTHSFPGFFGVPLFDVAVFLWHETQRVTIISRANAMAFSFFLALFPAIIFLFTVATLFPIYETFEHEINSYINYIMPSSAGLELQQAIRELVKPNSSLLSIGFALALYFASNGMLTMMEGFEKTHLRVFKKRTGLQKRLIAVALTLQLGFLLAASVLLVVLGDILLTWLVRVFQLTHGTQNIFQLFRWLVIVLVFYFGIALIYRYGAALHRRFKWITPGASMATVLSIASSLAFSFYVEAFDTYNKVYGSIGAIIVLMLWIQINCFILQAGFELNASIAVHRDLKEEFTEKESEG